MSFKKVVSRQQFAEVNFRKILTKFAKMNRTHKKNWFKEVFNIMTKAKYCRAGYFRNLK